MPLQLPHGFRQGSARRGSDHEHIDVARSVLLVSRERAIQIGFLNALECFEGLRNPGRRSDGFRDDAAHLLEQRILLPELKILLAANHFRPKESFALQTPQLSR